MKTTQLILLFLVTFASAGLALDPPPDGGYPNQNTAEGEDALFRLTGVSDGALKVFDASSNDVWFVPLAAPVTGGQQ